MTLEDLIKEAAREGNMRRAVYPNSKGSPVAKQRQLLAMDKIEAVLKAVAARPDIRAEIESAVRLEQSQPSLL